MIYHYDLIQIKESTGKEELLQILSEEEVIDLVTEAGYTKSLSSVELSDRNNLISTITTYHIFIKTKAMMDQFKEGLEDTGIYSYLKSYEDQMRPLFVNERVPLTAGETNISKKIMMSKHFFFHSHSSSQRSLPSSYTSY